MVAIEAFTLLISISYSTAAAVRRDYGVCLLQHAWKLMQDRVAG